MMLGAESCVPIDLRVIEFENTVLFSDFYIHVVWTGKNFIFEGSKFVLLANIVDLVDDGTDVGVFV